MNTRTLVIMSLIACLPTTGQGGSTLERDTATAEVTVNLNLARPVSPALLGHCLEYVCEAQGLFDSTTRQIRPYVIQLVRSLKPACLRFPGGTLSNYYRWVDGIGPVAKRVKGRPTWPPHDPYYPMDYGTDEYVQFARTIGVKELMITVNVPTTQKIDPWVGTAQEAAAWVAYCNATPDNKAVIGKDARGSDWTSAADWARKRIAHGHKEPYRVKYWELGNEIFTDLKNPAEYARVCCEFAHAMKAVDPSIQIGIVGNDFDFHLANSPWNRAVIDGTKGLADFFIAHFYLPGIAGGSIDATRICLASPDRFREKLRSLRKEAGNLDLAITEMACNLGINPENDPKSLSLHRSQQAAVFLADTLLALREAKVAVSNYWTIRGWHWSLIELADKKVIPQVPYLVYKLFADYEQTRFIPAAVRAGSIELDPARKTEFRRPTHPTLVAGGSIDPDQTRLTVFLINRALNNPTTVTVKFTGQTFRPKRCTLRVLAAEPNTVNTAENPSAAKIIDTPVQQIAPNAAKCTLPPCAVAALIWEGEKP